MTKPKDKKVILIDGHSLAYRSYFAFIRNPLRNSKGQNTSAIFGFVTSLKKIFNKFTPKYMAVVFDTGEETFRHKLYQDYKRERPETPSDLVNQLPLIKEIVDAYGVKILEKEGFEADDVLATIASRLAKQGMQVYIVTSDKDLYQLVNDHIFIYDVYKDIIYDREKTKEKFAISDPSLIRDILALAGDTIDNIPGVPGIGMKRATDIMYKYHSLEEAIKKDERLKGYQELIEISKQLATVKTNVRVKANLAQLKIKNKDIPRLIRIFKELEFSSLLRELANNVGAKVFQIPKQLEIKVEDRNLQTQYGFHLTDKELYIFDGKENLVLDDKLEIKKWLTSKTMKVGYDLKALMHRLSSSQIEITPPYFDTKIAAWLLDSTRKRYELNDLILQHFQIMANKLSDSDIAYYNFILSQKLEPEIFAHQLNTLFYEIELPLIKVLYDMEKRGVKIDTKLFNEMAEKINEEQETLKKKIYQQAGVEFNINSAQQLSKVLFEKLGLPKSKKIKTGYSTDSSVLQELASKTPIVQDILRYREITKLKTTYLQPMQELIKSETGRIHCEFNQTATSTGRLSASNPNLQNIPIKGELGRLMRMGFVAEHGNLLISADYSQIELRILAYISNDEKLKEAFLKGEDIHIRTASVIFNKKPEKITDEERRTAKMVNYGLIYGLSNYGLGASLGIDQFEAQRIIDDFLSIHHQVAEWREKTVEETKQTGYAKTIMGRIRPFPGIFAQNRIIYEAAVRAAINHPIQGSAADIIKKAMIEIDQELKAKNFKGGLIIQIHDELLFEIEEVRVREARAIIKDIMTKNILGDVPLEVNIGVGKNWAIAHSEAK